LYISPPSSGKEIRSSGLRLQPASAGFLLGIHFDPEDGGDMFLRNIGLSPIYAALQPRRYYSILFVVTATVR
jgi:hypothetical protein